MTGPTRIGVLVSGTGTNLQALLDRAGPYQVAVVVSNVVGVPALERARRARVPAVTIESRHRPREAFEADVATALDAHAVDLVCLAGFLRILSPGFVARRRGRIVNIHPALLPLFGGPGMYGRRVHEAVLASGAAESGCTIHVVDERVDTGPILAQARVPVLAHDTPETLAARIADEEHRLYPSVVARIATGDLVLPEPTTSSVPER